jgi:hypothetical protein
VVGIIVVTIILIVIIRTLWYFAVFPGQKECYNCGKRVNKKDILEVAEKDDGQAKREDWNREAIEKSKTGPWRIYLCDPSKESACDDRALLQYLFLWMLCFKKRNRKENLQGRRVDIMKFSTSLPKSTRNL